MQNIFKVGRARFVSVACAIALGGFIASAAMAQVKPPPPPPDPNTSSSKNPPNSSSGSGGGSTAPAKDSQAGQPDMDTDPAPLPAFDPLRAQKCVEVGTFYFKKGDYAAAIDRFKEATSAYATYAEPWLLMGQAYEKQRDLPNSIQSYQKYLELYPHAPTRGKLEAHIAELQTKLKNQPQKPAGK
jgi:tetratricopeptide (TPR) repeat protein